MKIPHGYVRAVDGETITKEFKWWCDIPGQHEFEDVSVLLIGEKMATAYKDKSFGYLKPDKQNFKVRKSAFNIKSITI